MKKKSTLEKTVEALPANPKKARVWTLEEDSVLLKFADEKGLPAIAKVIGVNAEAARRRFKQLKDRMGK